MFKVVEMDLYILRLMIYLYHAALILVTLLAILVMISQFVPSLYKGCIPLPLFRRLQSSLEDSDFLFDPVLSDIEQPRWVSCRQWGSPVHDGPSKAMPSQCVWYKGVVYCKTCQCT